MWILNPSQDGWLFAGMMLGKNDPRGDCRVSCIFLCSPKFIDGKVGNLEIWGIPSGKHTNNYGKSSCYQWENQLFLCSFSIAMLNYQRVSIIYSLETLFFYWGVVTVKRMTRQFDRNGMAMFRWRCLDCLADSGESAQGLNRHADISG